MCTFSLKKGYVHKFMIRENFLNTIKNYMDSFNTIKIIHALDGHYLKEVKVRFTAIELS